MEIALAFAEALRREREALLDHFCTEHRHQVCPRCASAMRRAEAGIPTEARDYSGLETINLSTRDADNGK